MAMNYHKIFELADDGSLRTLYHGVGHSRRLPLGVWLEAERKSVRDGSGGTIYASGFHVFSNEAQAERYLQCFTAPRLLAIAPIMAEGLRPKPTNPEVWLAERILIPKETLRNLIGVGAR